MKKRLILITCFLLVAFFCTMQLKPVNTTEVFSQNLVKYGSTGDDVYELQGRLKFLGFYNSNIDGDFGYRTLKAVKWFQGEFGLKVDGLVGPKTKEMLWKSTKSWKPSAPQTGGGTGGGGGAAPQQPPANANLPSSPRGDVSENDIRLMSNAVYGEARGEPYVGQVAVAAVILNRLKSADFPNTISGVIFQPRAFTAVDDGQIWLEPNETARKAVLDALNGWDPSNGCEYYFNPDTATSAWIWTRQQVTTIGKHIFCI